MPPVITLSTSAPADDTPRGIGIDGAWLLPLRIIDTPGGAVLHMLKAAAPLRPGCPCPDAPAADERLHLGEVYFSEVLPGHVKGWKRHSRQTQHFAVPSGRMALTLYDDRAQSPTQGVLCRLELGRPDAYALLRIPPGVWYAFAAVGDAPALLCNGADMPHDPAESETAPLDSPHIPYTWK